MLRAKDSKFWVAMQSMCGMLLNGFLLTATVAPNRHPSACKKWSSSDRLIFLESESWCVTHKTAFLDFRYIAPPAYKDARKLNFVNQLFIISNIH